MSLHDSFRLFSPGAAIYGLLMVGAWAVALAPYFR